MKYISFIIPCYNSSAYMKKCIDSCVHLGEDVEVLIIDDGSQKDNTLKIAKSYQKKYPKICRAIHKENGGHGDVLNVGIKNAKGLYVKVVDSDDWLGKAESKKLLATIKINLKKKVDVDLYVTNFIYDKVGQVNKKVMEFSKFLPRDKAITWDEAGTFPLGKYMLMHALTYKTKALRASKIKLPKHTFYVDNIYAYQPFPYVNTIYYLDINLYHYFIGRNDQSVNEQVMIGRLEQQYRVTRIMLYDVDLDKVKNKKTRAYMLNYMSIIMTITSVLSIRSGEKKWLKEKDKLWKELKKRKPRLYRELHDTFLGIGVNLPGTIGRAITIAVYKLAQLMYGFN